MDCIVHAVSRVSRAEMQQMRLVISVAAISVQLPIR